jgi:ATP-binding protein involved in chromosome partitioning
MTQSGCNGAKARIAIVSAKGGAGKSTLTVNLAAHMALKGRKVGIIDADFNAPSIATMLGLMPGILVPNNGVLELAVGPLGLKAAGLDLIAEPPLPFFDHELDGVSDSKPLADGLNTSVVPTRLDQKELLLSGVSSTDLELLFVDLATGAEPLREAADVVQLSGALIVTQSSPSALRATRSLIEVAASLSVQVLGIVENMTAFYCDRCRSVRPLLPQGGVFELSRETKLPLLARLPFDSRMAESCERGLLFVQQFRDAPLAKQLADLAQKVAIAVDKALYCSPPSNGPAL